MRYSLTEKTKIFIVPFSYKIQRHEKVVTKLRKLTNRVTTLQVVREYTTTGNFH